MKYIFSFIITAILYALCLYIAGAKLNPQIEIWIGRAVAVAVIAPQPHIVRFSERIIAFIPTTK